MLEAAIGVGQHVPTSVPPLTARLPANVFATESVNVPCSVFVKEHAVDAVADRHLSAWSLLPSTSIVRAPPLRIDAVLESDGVGGRWGSQVSRAP